jgi:hypothetical protein
MKDYPAAIAIYENLTKLKKFSDISNSETLKIWIDLADLYCEVSNFALTSSSIVFKKG